MSSVFNLESDEDRVEEDTEENQPEIEVGETEDGKLAVLFLRPDQADRVQLRRSRGGPDPAVRAILGDEKDEEKLHQRLSTYNEQQWSTVCEALLTQNIDSNSTHNQVLTCFQYFYQLFCFNYDSEEAVIKRIRSIYPQTNQMSARYAELIRLYGSMQVEMMARDMLDEKTEVGQAFKRRMNQAAYNMKMTLEYMISARLLMKGYDVSVRAMLEELNPMTMFREVDHGKLKKPQQLIHYCYRQGFKQGYRKDGKSLYRPRYTEDGDFTCSYELVSDISDFVFGVVYPIEQNHYWFECLTEKQGTASHVISALENIRSEWLPELKRNRMIHSFRNGVFCLDLNVFCWYKPRPEPGKHTVSDLTGNVVAIKYHDQEFDELGMEAEQKADVEQGKTPSPHYISIKIPEVDKILKDQEFSMLERMFIYNLLGRLFFPIGDRDSWGVFPFFFGMAGTGKSTLLRLVASAFEARDVGFLSNALQKTFALEGIVTKLVYFALDIDGHFQLDQVTWQSMVVGEEVSVLRKFKTPLEVKWDIPGGFAANKLMNWTDNAGSLARRLIIVEFINTIRSSDPNLFEKCKKEMDRFLKVTVSAYHDYTERYSHQGIKEVMPQKFHESEKKAILEMNALMAFITECCDVQPSATEKTMITPCKEFSVAFKKFCQDRGISHQPLSHDMTTPVFSKQRIRKIERPKPDDPFAQTSSYYLGVKLVAEE